MGIKIDILPRLGFTIKLDGIRSRFVAHNEEELHQAIEHYFGKGEHHRERPDNCPLCRE